MPTPLSLLLAVLATYRLARLISIDDGPGDVFLNVRAWAGAYEYAADGRPQTGTGRLVTCPYCTGLWVALGIAVLVTPPAATLSQFLLIWLGIAGGQAWLQVIGGAVL